MGFGEFVRDGVAASATFLSWGNGDSRFARYQSGVIYGFALALTARAGGCRGYMCGMNLDPQGTGHDGLIEGGRRDPQTGTTSGSTPSSHQMGFSTGQPAGCVGIPIIGPTDVPTTLTTGGGINSSATTLAVAAVTSQWSTGTGDIYIKIDDEIIYSNSRSGTTLSSCTRGVLGTLPAAHSQGATVRLLSFSSTTAANSNHWRQNMSAWIPSGLTQDVFNAGLQITNLSPIGINGDLKYFVSFENANASSGGQATVLYVEKIADGASYPTAADAANLAPIGSSFNPCPGGTVGALGIQTHTIVAAARSTFGLCGAIGSIAGPALFNWQGFLNTGVPGGVVYSRGTSAGGRSLGEFISSVLRTPNSFAGLVKTFQTFRSTCSSAHGGGSKPRLINLIEFMANDVTNAGMNFCSATKSWTVKYTKTCSGSYLSGATSIALTDASDLPTAGHWLNPTTGERGSYTGISGGTTLTGVTKGDFGTTAAASSGAADTLLFGHIAGEGTGFAADVDFLKTWVDAAWDAADVSAQNATYPLIASGSQVAVRADVLPPNSANEVFHIVERPPPVSDAPVYGVAGAFTSPTLAQREGRWNEFRDAVRANVTGNIEVADLSEVTTAAQGAARGHWDDPADSIHQSHRGFAEPLEAWFEARISTTSPSGQLGGGGAGSRYRPARQARGIR